MQLSNSFNLTQAEYNKYIRISIGICGNNKFLAEDLLHFVLLRMIKTPPVLKTASMSTYIHYCLINERNRRIKYYNRHISFDYEYYEENTINNAYFDQDFDRYKELYEKIDRLPEKQKKIINKCLQDKSFNDIMVEDNMKYDTVKANYRHAILKLRK